MGNYTLWCLNRVAEWDLPRLARALAVKGLWSAKHDVQLGSRATFASAADGRSGNRPGVLMHEEADCNEYFVPLAVKCIGDPDGFEERFEDRMSASGRDLFASLRGDFARYFSPVGPPPAEPLWRSYWGRIPVNNALWKVGMYTRTDGKTPFAGLYEIVATEARATKRKAILAGYSQGGLVARFLAWMDEHLMNDDARAIAGVVLVQTPNHGSPLADRANADNASTGLLGLMAGLGGYPIVGATDPLTRAAIEALVAGRAPPGDPVWHFGVGAVCRLLDAAIGDPPSSQPKRGDLLRTARKWLTGLCAEAIPTAFDDLDPAGLDDPRTILGRLLREPLAETLHGAIVGADSALDDLVVEGMGCLERWLVRHFVAKRLFETAQSAYARIAMDEVAAGVPKGPRHQEIATLYQTGLADPAVRIDLPAFAHDFVIPSVSQALYPLAPPTAPGVFLGNKLNPKATHVSGADEQDPDSDAPLVRAMLADLGERLP